MSACTPPTDHSAPDIPPAHSFKPRDVRYLARGGPCDPKVVPCWCSNDSRDNVLKSQVLAELVLQCCHPAGCTTEFFWRKLPEGLDAGPLALENACVDLSGTRPSADEADKESGDEESVDNPASFTLTADDQEAGQYWLAAPKSDSEFGAEWPMSVRRPSTKRSIWGTTKKRKVGGKGLQSMKQVHLHRWIAVACCSQARWEEMQAVTSYPLEVVHLCGNAMCVRPMHLQVSTHEENRRQRGHHALVGKHNVMDQANVW